MVCQREIIEVSYIMPNGKILNHPALVLSSDELFNKENGMFYAVLISTKNYHPDYTIKIEDEWLNKPMGRESYFVTHIVTYFTPQHIINRMGTFMKEEFFDRVVAKIIKSIFELDIDYQDE